MVGVVVSVDDLIPHLPGHINGAGVAQRAGQPGVCLFQDSGEQRGCEEQTVIGRDSSDELAAGGCAG